MLDDSPTSPDFYDILGIDRDAPTAKVKAAFREKAKTLHPDAGGDPEEFRLLKLAYDVLSDRDLRRQYDRTGQVPPELNQKDVIALAGDLLVASLLQSGEPELYDVVAAVRTAATQQIAVADRQIALLQELRRRLLLTAERIQTSAEKNLLRQVVLDRQKQIEIKITETRSFRDRHERLLMFLEDYHYTVSGFDDDII